MARTVAYLRVSVATGDNEKNKLAILEYANEKGLPKVQFVEEKVSGMRTWTDRKIYGILNDLEAGDVLVVSELSRLGRSMLEIMEIISAAVKKGVKMHALKGSWVLDDSLTSKIIAMVFSIAAEIERDLISQRTKESLASAKAKGKQLGRPKGPGKSKLDDYAVEIQALINNGSTKRFIAKRYKVTEPTLINWLKKNSVVKQDPETVKKQGGGNFFDQI
jgi:DNA invertase Pin-like site-specific DNA recombinase